jgi:hypothetical protein
MIVLFCLYQCIPDTLCERFYTVVVGECGVAGIIQIIKTICKHKYSSKDKNDKDDKNETSDFDTGINDEGDGLNG